MWIRKEGKYCCRKMSRHRNPPGPVSAIYAAVLRGLRDSRSTSRKSSPSKFDPLVKLRQRQFALQPVPLFLFASVLLQSRQEIKSDVRRLEILRVRVRNVVG